VTPPLLKIGTLAAYLSTPERGGTGGTSSDVSKSLNKCSKGWIMKKSELNELRYLGV